MQAINKRIRIQVDKIYFYRIQFIELACLMFSNSWCALSMQPCWTCNWRTPSLWINRWICWCALSVQPCCHICLCIYCERQDSLQGWSYEFNFVQVDSVNSGNWLYVWYYYYPFVERIRKHSIKKSKLVPDLLALRLRYMLWTAYLCNLEVRWVSFQNSSTSCTFYWLLIVGCELFSCAMTQFYCKVSYYRSWYAKVILKQLNV